MFSRFLRPTGARLTEAIPTGPQASLPATPRFPAASDDGRLRLLPVDVAEAATLQARMPAVQSRALQSRLLILALAVCMIASCSTDQLITTERHYLQPAPGKKIPPSTTALRVCADPNNLPFSNQRGEGFENKIAEIIASEMQIPVEYTWWAQRRGFFRNTLRQGLCDVVIGMPAISYERAETTRPYYRSTYVFVTRRDRDLDIKSLDDPRLRELTIGVQMIGDDGTNSPPVHALNKRGLVENLKGYTVYGDYSEQNPPARVVDAVERGDVDVAIVWGPLAGYFASDDLMIQPIDAESEESDLPFAFDIAIGVRHGEDEFRDRITTILERRREDIEKVLDEYHIPRVGGS